MSFSLPQFFVRYWYIQYILCTYSVCNFIPEDAHVTEQRSFYSNIASLGTPNDISGIYDLISPLADDIVQFESDLTRLEHNLVSLEDQITVLTEAIPPLATKDDLLSATNSSSYMGTHLQAIQESLFTTDIDNLHAINQNIMQLQASISLLINLFADPIALVNMAKNSIALTTTVMSGSTAPSAATYLTIYNSAITTALTAVTIATQASTQSKSSTDLAIDAVIAAQTAWNNLNAAWIANGQGVDDRPSSISSAVEIQTALSQLLQSLYILQRQQS